MELRNKKVIVTGGVSGLGRSMVELFLSKGAAVTVFDLNAQGLDQLAQTHPTVVGFQCDLSDYDQVAATTARFHERFGAADVLVNNAGIIYSAPLVCLSPAGIVRHDVAMWRKVLDADLSSVFYTTLCVIEKMIATRTRGVVVNISSVSAAGNVGQSAYSAAKAGVNALTATWAKELGMMGIRVAAVAPGYSETGSTKSALSEPVLKEIVKRVPLRRLGKPEEIAQAVVAVVENDFFTGKVFEVDGGLVV
ncbi:MAG: SDR family oxidoreductase [Verrucomicrobia bacterium]|nr:SDR family oxidoreductase [Verrucomicrobiota bacterium]